MNEMLEGCLAWPQEFAQRYRAKGYWDDIFRFKVLSRTAQQLPDKRAVVDGARSITYAGLLRRTELLAAGLSGLGRSPGNRVVFQLNSNLELIETHNRRVTCR